MAKSVFKLKKNDYENEKVMLEHLRIVVQEYRKQANDLVVESTYRFGELDHIFIFVNWKRM